MLICLNLIPGNVDKYTQCGTFLSEQALPGKPLRLRFKAEDNNSNHARTDIVCRGQLNPREGRAQAPSNHSKVDCYISFGGGVFTLYSDGGINSTLLSHMLFLILETKHETII